MRFIVTIGLSAILASLAACGDVAPTTSNASAHGRDSTTRVNDSCSIALTAHQGEDATDREIARFQSLAHRNQNPIPYLERLGWAYIAKARTSFDPGYYKLAEQTAFCIDTNQPGASEGLLLHGHVQHQLHAFSDAEAIGRKLVSQRGLWFDHALLGDALMEQGKLAEAIPVYQHMIDLRPGPHAYARVAHVRWLKGDLAGAMELMEMAAHANGERDRESTAWSYVRLALYAMQAGNTQAASSYVEAALSMRPDYAPALLVRGRMLLASGEIAEAIAALTHAARSDPLPEYQWALVEALRENGQADQATDIEDALMARGAMDDPRTFSLYLATVGRDLSTALRLAREEMTRRADVFTADALAWALHAAGQDTEARQWMQRALAEGTQDARLFLHAGVIAARAGQAQDAAKRLEQASAQKQMLLPSERAQLTAAIAALHIPVATKVSAHADHSQLN